MQLRTVADRSWLRRLTAPALLVLATFLFSTLGGNRLLAAAEPGTDKPLARVATAKGRVALTFDVTHGKEQLDAILAALQQENVRATFFVGGTFLNLHPETVRLLAAQGHEVATLGQLIVDLSGKPEIEVVSNLLASQSAIARSVGAPARYFRTPYGAASPTVVRAAKNAGLTTVSHTLELKDHLGRKGDEVVDEVRYNLLKRVKEGDILRLPASDFARGTSAALPVLLQGLKAKGLNAVPLSELVTPRN